MQVGGNEYLRLNWGKFEGTKSLKWLNINKMATEGTALVLTPENHHISHTKSLPRLH